jgi:hypothetical protein
MPFLSLLEARYSIGRCRRFEDMQRLQVTNSRLDEAALHASKTTDGQQLYNCNMQA